jgi:hypothetical protein
MDGTAWALITDKTANNPRVETRIIDFHLYYCILEQKCKNNITACYIGVHD